MPWNMNISRVQNFTARWKLVNPFELDKVITLSNREDRLSALLDQVELPRREIQVVGFIV
jgi:hypothetical protein